MKEKSIIRILIKKLLLFVIGVVIVTSAFAKVITPVEDSPIVVTGIVSNESGIRVPGVNVVEKGTFNGVITDKEGKFTIHLKNEYSSLIFSFIGYQTQIVEVRGNSQLNVILKIESEILADIVITGQGIGQDKKRLTSKAAIVSEATLEKNVNTRIDQILQSEIPNLQISMIGGQPGSSSNIRARGVSSGFTNTTPIIYVDGVRMDNLNGPSALGAITGYSNAANSSVANIPVENIERIEFVNGGAATTLYGADAANGVIQIFTKKGTPHKMHAFAKVETGFEKATADFYHFDATEDLLNQNGFIQKYSLGIKGGGEAVTFSFTGGMEHNTGTRIHNQNENKRYFLSLGTNAYLSKNIRYSGSMNYNSFNYNRIRSGNLGGYTGLWSLEGGAIKSFSFDNKLDEMEPEEYAQLKDFVSEAERLQDRTAKNRRFQMSHSFVYSPNDNFNLKMLVGIDHFTQRESDIISNEYLTATNSSNESSITNTKRDFLGLTLEAIAGYNFEIGDFSFNNQLGLQGFRNDEEQVEYKGTNIPNGAVSIENAANTSADQRIIELANYGIFFNTNINYLDKYTFEFGLRGDKSEAFGDQIGMQYYPRLGLSYLISEEDFIAASNMISNWKIRANYGEAGNLPPAYAHERTINYSGYNGDIAVGFGQPGNSSLKPEKIQSFEIGTELELFNSYLTLGIDYYTSKTVDALMYAPQIPSTGSSSFAIQNIGEISNNGFEFSLKGDIIRSRKLTLSAFATLNTLENEVKELNGLPPFAINGFSERTIQIVVMEGESVGVLRGNKAIWENNVITGYDALSVLGKTTPDIYGNFGISLNVSNFNFFINADYQKGAAAHSFDRQFRYVYGASDEGIPQEEIEANGRSNWLAMTDQFVEKTDFIKVRTIAATYALNLHKYGLNQIVFSANVINPFNFSSSSFDPEVSQAGSKLGQGSLSTGGIAYAIESTPRQFLFGVNFKF
ncbi:TonB-dependent receptor domain-containing protein [Marinifilum sp.]|uniref:TonB-dependent receptor domain-containing protein n=1 Tax=Marinifilum sp. TaxID=2033137 RepID=UPI003BACA8BE